MRRARLSGFFLSRATSASPAHHDAGLGPAQELVAREGDQVDPGRHHVGNRGLVGKPVGAQVDERPRAQILHHGNSPLPSEPGQLARGDLGRESHHPVVGGVNLEEQGRVRSDGLGVVAQVRPVGGAHLAQAGPAAQHDVGDAELAADLDQLSPRHHHLAAAGQRLQGEQDGGGVVVDDERVLGARQAPEEPLHVGVARAALLGGEIELQVAVGGGDGRHPGDGRLAQERPAEIGVKHDPGGVDDRPEREEAGARRRAHARGRGSLGLRGDCPPAAPAGARRRAPRAPPR